MTDQARPQDAPSPDANWEALARYVAGESTSEERAEIRRALDGDPARAALLSALDDAFRAPVPAALTSAEIESALASVLARRDVLPMRETSRRGQSMSRRLDRSLWDSTGLRVAAAVLVVAGAGLLWKTSGSGATGSESAQTRHFASAVGALDSVQLADGSRVLLGPGSELTVASDFGKTTREMTLKGEARFDVVHDASHPFVVHTASASFRDVGTVFSVHSDAADGARIAVSSGSVAVRTTAGSPEVTLAAGDRATVATAGTVQVERNALTSEDLAWTSGKLVFRDAPLGQVSADLHRWYGIDLTVDSTLARRTLTATFDRASSADVGPTLAAVLGGAFQQDGNSIRVISLPTAVPQK